jgi:hypothetical protein
MRQYSELIDSHFHNLWIIERFSARQRDTPA